MLGVVSLITSVVWPYFSYIVWIKQTVGIVIDTNIISVTIMVCMQYRYVVRRLLFGVCF